MRPKTIAQAVKALEAPDAFALAGGTYLLGRDMPAARTVVDLQSLPLAYLRADRDGLHVGALVTLEGLARGAEGAGSAADLLKRAAAFSAQFTERQAATIGGMAAAPGWCDLDIALIAVDAWARVIWSGGVEVVPYDVLARDRQAWLDRGTLITELFIPHQPEGARFGLARVSRTPRDRAQVAVAVRLARQPGRRIGNARVAVGGAVPRALRLPDVENMLEGRALNDSEILQAGETARRAVHPDGDAFASSEYRQAMAAVLVRRALAEAAG